MEEEGFENLLAVCRQEEYKERKVCLAEAYGDIQDLQAALQAAHSQVFYFAIDCAVEHGRGSHFDPHSTNWLRDSIFLQSGSAVQPALSSVPAMQILCCEAEDGSSMLSTNTAERCPASLARKPMETLSCIIYSSCLAE